MTIGCYTTDSPEKCDALKATYDNENYIKAIEMNTKKLTGVDTKVEINIEVLKSSKDLAKFPSKVKETSNTALLMAYSPISKNVIIDLEQLATGCFFTINTNANSNDLMSDDTNKQKLMKTTAKLISANNNIDRAHYSEKIYSILSTKSTKAYSSSPVYVKASLLALSKVWMLMVIGEVSFVGDCYVNFYYFSPYTTTISSDSGLIRSNYLILGLNILNDKKRMSFLEKSFPINAVAILDPTDYISKVQFTPSSWIFFWPDAYKDYEAENGISKQVSFVRTSYNLELYCKGEGTSSVGIQNLNISFSASYVKSQNNKNNKASGTNVVDFTGEWGYIIGNPEIILESPDPESIIVKNTPKSVNIKKAKYNPVNIVKEYEKSKTALIVGVTIGVIALVAIVAGLCVFFLYIRPKRMAKSDDGVKKNGGAVEV